MNHKQLLYTIKSLSNKKITQQQIADILGVSINTIGSRAIRNSIYTDEEIQKISDYFNIDIFHKVGKGTEVLYRPNVYLCSDYDKLSDNEQIEYMILDERLFSLAGGEKINPSDCEVVTVSGNSMSPEWQDGSRVILDKSRKDFIDGQIFVFKLNNKCYIREICLMPDKTKAIPLNKDYEPFFISKNDNLTIFGRILPKVRL